MKTKDNLLQNYISMLEAGESLEEVLARLPEQDADLRALIRLTAAIRALPRPVPGLSSHLNGRVHAAFNNRLQSKSPLLSMGRPRWATVSALAFSFLLLCSVAIAWFGWASLFRQTAGVLTIQSIRGPVEVAFGEAAWQPVREGETLAEGQRIRSGSHATAVLQFADGSVVYLAPNSELTLNVLQQQGETLQVEWLQSVGHTRHQVTPLRNADSRYVVHTPSGDAQVLGTIFSVSVAANGYAYFAVDEGLVTVQSEAGVVSVAAGHATETRAGHAPASPVQYFRSQGQLVQQMSGIWQIDGTLVYLSGATVLTDAFTSGDFVLVSGRILPNGRWQADSVEPVENPSHETTFAGEVQAITPELWLVGGVSLTVSQTTQRAADLAPGDLVRVYYVTNAQGHRVAQRIETLSAAANTRPQPETTPTAAQHAQPSLTFEPDELEAAGCETTFVLTGTLINEGSEPKDIASGVELGLTVVSGVEHVQNVTLTPTGWDTIEAGQVVSFTIQIDLNDSWLTAPAGTEVKARIYIAAETNRPDHHIAQLTITLTQTCDVTPTPTATSDSLPTPTPTGTPPQTPTATPPAGTTCTDVNPHPEGLRLAQVHQVSYEEIMGWFCQGFGFGEIDLAYSLSAQTGTSVSEIFAMRASGMGWGEIMQALGLLPGGGPPFATPTAMPTFDPSTTPALPTLTATPQGPPSTPPGPPAPPPGPPITPPGPPAWSPGTGNKP